MIRLHCAASIGPAGHSAAKRSAGTRPPAYPKGRRNRLGAWWGGDVVQFDDEDDDTKGEIDELENATRSWLNDSNFEVICLVEGIDSVTSAALQARFSYTSNDIQWNHSFAPCVSRNEENGAAVIDFSKFHSTIALPFDPENIQSH